MWKRATITYIQAYKIVVKLRLVHFPVNLKEFLYILFYWNWYNNCWRLHSV